MTSHDSKDGESPGTVPEVPIEPVEGLTDRPPIMLLRTDDTQIAMAPERPATPATEMVHHVSGPLDFDALPELPRTQLTSQSSYSPELRRRRRTVYTAITAVLSLIIIMSVYQIQSLGGSDESGDLTVPVPPTKVSPPGPSEPPPLVPVANLEELDRGQTTRGLLALSLEEILTDGRRQVVRVEEDVIGGNAVTVVNLWATWCKPCKEELPGFTKLFARSAWGDDVRFAPILIDSKDAVWAREKFAELMPAGVRFFVDPLQGAVVDALRSPKLLQADSGLPVTLLFDCRRRVRAFYTKGLTEADFVKLEEIVQTLRGELKAPYCRSKPRRTLPPPPPFMVKKNAVARCGNRACELGEHAENCCDCLPCTANKRCESPDGVPICVDTANVLKD